MWQRKASNGPDFGYNSSPYREDNQVRSGGHTTVTYSRNPTFCERMTGAFAGAAIGVVLVMCATGLLFYNEGRAVTTSMSLDEGLDRCVSIDPSKALSKKLDNSLVHVTGPLDLDGHKLTDHDFNIAVAAARYERLVDMYQYKETTTVRKIKEGDYTREEKSFRYDASWSATLIDSASFSDRKYRNPTHMATPPTSLSAAAVHLGPLTLSASLVNQIDDWAPYEPEVNKNVLSSLQLARSGKYLVSGDPQSPKIGDIRVYFRVAGRDGSKFSAIGKQKGSGLLAFQTKAGDKLQMLAKGGVSMEDMFARAQSTNTSTTWLLRLAGWLMMALGMALVASPITTFLSWIPIVSGLANLVSYLMVFLLSVTSSLTVIAVGWIRYRPFVGVALLLLASIPFFWGSFRGRRSTVSSN